MILFNGTYLISISPLNKYVTIMLLYEIIIVVSYCTYIIYCPKNQSLSM